jgi:ABC-type lipoprotein export system ATPase subunit
LNILNGVNFSLREKSFGLIFGKSGSGKTTLLQLLAGLNKPTSGSICIQGYGDDGQPKADPDLLPTEKVGIVFQFPER